MKNNYPELEAKIEKAINYFVEDIDTVRAGRANTAVLNKISVDYYGTMSPINQVAAVSTPDPRTIAIQPWDATLIKDIEKAILASEIGINPQNDGKVIRLAFPQLTEDRRKELTKTVAKKSEDCKVVIRGIRRDEIEKYKTMKKNSEITEDDLKGIEKDIQDIIDAKIKEVDKLAENKNKEIMEI
ncbi:MAG: ribosome recycling factor [Clostridia bacterium]|nr:ribosome recycling factor [Clostridia bacterium]